MSRPNLSVPGKESAANILEFIPSAHSTADSTPYASNASDEEEKKNHTKLAEHVDEWCKLQAESPVSCAKAVRSDSTSDFSPEGIASMSNHAVN